MIKAAPVQCVCNHHQFLSVNCYAELCLFVHPIERRNVQQCSSMWVVRPQSSTPEEAAATSFMGCSQSSPMEAEEPPVPVIQDQPEVLAGDKNYNVVTIGAEGVGKSCLAQRAVYNTYTDSMLTTAGGAGVSFVDIEVAGELGCATAKCEIADTAG